MPQRGWNVEYFWTAVVVSGSAVLEREHRFVLGTVIFVDAANVFPERDAPDEEQEQAEADGAVDQVEDDASAESGIDLLQFCRRQQRDVLVHEDEEGERDDRC